MKVRALVLAAVLSSLATTARADGPVVLDPEPPPLPTGSMVYVLATEPCRVLIDGSLVGTAPVLIADLSTGIHRLSVESDSRVFRRALDVVSTVRAIVRVEAVMHPYSGTLSVDTHGLVAEVLVEGTAVGRTPLHLERIASGTYAVSLISPDRARVERSVVVPPDGTVLLEVEMEPGHPLRVEPPPPSGAILELPAEGREKTSSYPFPDLPLFSAGVRSFRILAQGFEPFEFRADPATTADAPVPYSPKRLEGGVRLVGLPRGSVVIVDGKKVDLPSGANVITSAPGVLTIEIQAPWFFPYAGMAAVDAGKTVDLRLGMRKDTEAVRKIAAWATIASGVLLSGAGVLLNQDSVAVPLSSTYSAYVTWKYSSIGVLGAGAAAAATGVFLLLFK